MRTATIKAHDDKRRVFLVLTAYIEDVLPFILMMDFWKFYSDKIGQDQIFDALPMIKEWFEQRGYKVTLDVDPSKSFYIRWWSRFCLWRLDIQWRIKGMSLFPRRLDDDDS